MKLLRFHATWCQPCKRFEPIVSAFAEKHGIPVEQIDVEEHPERAAKHGVFSVPVTVALSDQDEVLITLHGAMPSPMLESALREFL